MNVSERVHFFSTNTEQPPEPEKNLRKHKLTELFMECEITFSVSIFDTSNGKQRPLFHQGSTISGEHINALSNIRRSLVTISHSWADRNDKALLSLLSILDSLPPDNEANL